ncbi:hypothetical protein AB0H45_35140 [Streptomyces atroolivaceus]|uniref:hypothetical protein n=1 Tax=Streptomyces TaxID=1883 RepID=UPI0033E7ADB4
MATERTEQPQCTCPDAAEYHQPGCPEYEALPDGRPLTDWERTHMLDAATAGDVDYGELDDSDPVWVRLPGNH